MILRIVTGILFLACALHSWCQEDISNINLDRIPQKKVRCFITELKENRVKSFNDIRASFSKWEDTTEYFCVNKHYLFRENLNSVWESYIINDMAELWCGKRVSYGVSVSKPLNKVLYRNESKAGAHTGQILFLNLKLMKGIYKLATAFEITEIDPVKKIIVFNYIEGGKSRGTQILRFIATDDGCTEIEHKTFFKSDSHFRDKRLYPFFHKKLIDEFHSNVMKCRAGKNLN